MTLPRQVTDKILVAPSGCWIWTASRTPNGYGRIGAGRKTWRAHRYVYTLIVGPIADGMTLDHLCRVRACVNPSHLEPVTRGENVRRGIPRNAKKTHCPAGHAYVPGSYYGAQRGRRQCKECLRLRGAARRSAA